MTAQTRAIEFLSTPAAFENGGEVEVIETHGAIVFLCGDTALKLKRAVKYDYMDLSTLDLRRSMLEREVELNAPTAPMIYRDVVPLTEGDTGLSLGGDGPVVDWVLRMWRFPTENEFEEIVARGELNDRLATETGVRVAQFHAVAPVIRRPGDVLVADILAELSRVFAGFPEVSVTEKTKSWLVASQEAFEAVRTLLAVRGQEGHVRRGHGDLHLRNIVLIDDRPVLFDALEFDEELGTCDILYDIAFLVMDICHRGLRAQACRVLDAWLSEARGEEDAGLAALPLFLSVRAAIRAMVLLQTDAARNSPGASKKEIAAYLDLAHAVLKPRSPVLIAVGGYSGTGKSALARQLAPSFGPVPGAVMVSSDVERKVGRPSEARLPESNYTPEQRGAVYDRMLERAGTILNAGHAVLLDATFLDMGRRDQCAELARRAGVPFCGLWLNAPQDTLEARIRARGQGISDADVEVLRRQLRTPVGRITWHSLDAAPDMPNVLRAAIEFIGRETLLRDASR